MLPLSTEPTREEIDQSTGPLLLEFGASWCPHCQAIQADLAKSLAEAPEVRHIKIEDGPGRPLGRSFRVKLWPTFVLMRNGQIIQSLVRPAPEILQAEIANFLALVRQGA